MGMNMIGKSTEHVLNILKENFKLLDIVTLSGNTCTDKKTTSINWINGRGKRVIMESIISSKSLGQILKVTPDDIVNLNIQKNLIGSSLAGSIGGFNCNTANIIAGIFIATGQDCGQIGTSSASIINFKAEKDKLRYQKEMEEITKQQPVKTKKAMVSQPSLNWVELNIWSFLIFT